MLLIYSLFTHTSPMHNVISDVLKCRDPRHKVRTFHGECIIYYISSIHYNTNIVSKTHCWWVNIKQMKSHIIIITHQRSSYHQ